MIETDRQLAIVKQINKAGGHAYKATNAYTSGILDLAAWVPGFAPVVIEVKDLGTITTKSGKFDRKVETTKLQRDTMDAVNAVARKSDFENTVAFVMVTWKLGNTIYVASLPSNQPCISSEHIECGSRLNDLHLSITQHLQAMGVPAI